MRVKRREKNSPEFQYSYSLMKSSQISFLKSHWDKILLVFFILTYIVVFSALSVLRHDSFYTRFDLTNMDQTLYYTLNGHFFSFRWHDEILSRFSAHADLILVFLSPLYLIYDDVRILLVSGTVLLGLGA